ncbi:phosphohistidine phosphatase SixA [Pseudomonas fluorescens]|uniref:Phosphohistidine phosphatase SixA n=1 Tax=Pseudomonas fluorescens TaxID=294 RepID=A0A944HBI6_PSEFL|nr:phosphohistidine phosphatase SixA [Pseudomonas fluorescens]MBT2293908.1 phosphohistidine phosphatase SixA [Pseudomonas fluorescens]MBT2307435.1 phosphohistidine phosphatase SixA [Pseudomonas fluorescens]MBT2311368.1 phosphohistidine phosphatase SixA [Pseudomonas fluorescens]MBT2319577.1 phosphohistidine phosphatase SixA [Pseudomonas fluorescens]MBT2327312.1 phosphohistidine phosphatase SixA [Pseudomonas fluorescens]
MKLWVLRHGEAEPHGARPDPERTLTLHGREEVLRSAGRLMGEPLRAIYASPYVRAQQTAHLVREALGFEPALITVDWLTPETRPQTVLEHLKDQDDVLLVSHNPLVGSLLGFLQHGHLQQPEQVQTAGLAELEGDLPLAGSMTLKGIKHP